MSKLLSLTMEIVLVVLALSIIHEGVHCMQFKTLGVDVTGGGMNLNITSGYSPFLYVNYNNTQLQNLIHNPEATNDRIHYMMEVDAYFLTIILLFFVLEIRGLKSEREEMLEYIKKLKEERVE